ncbi:TspO/MBR family protein [Pseudidiomarina mangrovi]|uniref:TspO/MBR family protein n=1 Tax=Pseudidiomarina mangrovi TaxID=2487133 RepID=UPI000FCA4F65|nr:TspO/MBR family protein [Pseudidiomarina mangrovi]
MTTTKQVLGLVGWLILVYAAAAIGAAGSMNAPEFYTELVRPTWAPPAWLFGPVWTVLYAMMAVAAWQIWRLAGSWQAAARELWWFVAQLLLNALWSWVFFAWYLGAAAFVEIILLWLAIVVTMVLFWRRDKLAGALLLPYLAWVTFATALTFAMWQGNPTIL